MELGINAPGTSERQYVHLNKIMIELAGNDKPRHKSIMDTVHRILPRVRSPFLTDTSSQSDLPVSTRD